MIGLSPISTDRLRQTLASAKEEPRGGVIAFKKDWRAANLLKNHGSNPIRELFSDLRLKQPRQPNRVRTKRPQKRLEKRKNADVEEKRPGQNQKRLQRTNNQSSAHSAFQRCLCGIQIVQQPSSRLIFSRCKQLRSSSKGYLLRVKFRKKAA